MRDLDRKAETRRKIMLGGLIVKAKLDAEPTAVLLGLLLDAYEKLQDKNSQALKSEWRLKGDIALTLEKKLYEKLSI